MYKKTLELSTISVETPDISFSRDFCTFTIL